MNVFVTRYEKDDGVLRETVKLARRLAAEQGYQVDEDKIGGARALTINGHGESWVMWAAKKHVVKVGGRGRDDVPDAMVASYADRYPSVLPGGSLEGPLPAGPDDAEPTKANDEEAPYDPNNPKPDLDKYDPKKTEDPGQEDEVEATSSDAAHAFARARPKRRRCSIASTRFEDGVDDAVAAILADVRARGDEAVAEYTRQFDTASRRTRSARARWDELAGAGRARAVRARARARGARGSARFTSARSSPISTSTLDGVRLELRVTPLARVGLYVPGGTARYPSSVLMTAIPAKVAGVREVVMVTPGASPEAMLAARLAGVDRVFELGGAQAVGALAYGTADRAARRQDRRAGQRVGRVGEAPGLRRGRHRFDRRPVGGA